jgi:hypothetical protein
MYRSTFLDLCTNWNWVVSFTSRQLYPLERAPVTHWIGGWVNLRADLDDAVPLIQVRTLYVAGWETEINAEQVWIWEDTATAYLIKYPKPEDYHGQQQCRNHSWYNLGTILASAWRNWRKAQASDGDPAVIEPLWIRQRTFGFHNILGSS